MFNTVLIALFPLLMGFAAAFDLLTMRIPNWISLAIIVLFAACALAVGLPIMQVGLHLAVGVVVLVVAFLLFIPGWIGGGDAKFAAAVGLWMGTTSIAGFLAFAAIFGGVLTVVLLFFRWKVPVSWLPKAHWILRLHDKNTGVPYGIALAAGALFVYVNTSLFTALVAGV